MKNLTAFIIFLFIFLSIYTCVSFGADDKKLPEDKPQPPPSQSRPILPPTISPVSSGVSPTPSPHISTPSIPTGVINMPTHGASAFSTGHIPSAPAHVAAPTVPFQPRMPQVPIIESTTGKVVGAGKDRDAIPWI